MVNAGKNYIGDVVNEVEDEDEDEDEEGGEA